MTAGAYKTSTKNIADRHWNGHTDAQTEQEEKIMPLAQ